jgi:hypothetical protein
MATTASKLGPLDLLMGAALHANPLVGMIGGIVSNVIGQQSAPSADAAKPTPPAPAAVAQAVMDVVADKLDAAGATIVPTKPAWLSKINWVQLAGPIASLAAAYGLDLSAGQISGLVIAVQTVQSIVTWILRTWFTTALTPGAAR